MPGGSSSRAGMQEQRPRRSRGVGWRARRDRRRSSWVIFSVVVSTAITAGFEPIGDGPKPADRGDGVLEPTVIAPIGVVLVRLLHLL